MVKASNLPEKKMNKRNSPTFDLNQSARKFFLSAFVVTAFAAYVAHDRLGTQASTLTTNSAGQSNTQTSGASLAPGAPLPSSRPTSTPSSMPPTASTASAGMMTPSKNYPVPKSSTRPTQ